MTEGKRGSIEISTCIFKYIMSHPDIEHVKMMSNSCGGQQKNFTFSAMCQYAVNTHPTLKTIDHVFFEPGHSHMECDSVHSKIEAKSKNTSIYTLEGWVHVIQFAHTKPSPFKVIQLLHDEFLNFNQRGVKYEKENIAKPKGKQHRKFDNDLENGDQNVLPSNFKYSNGVWFQYRKNDNKKIFMKTSIDGEF